MKNIAIIVLAAGKSSRMKTPKQLVKIGNNFPVELQLLSKSFNGASLNVQLLHKGKLIQQKQVEINQNIQAFNVPFVLNSNIEGVNKYEFKIDYLDGEITYKNN